MRDPGRVRPSAVAGMFYPAEAEPLRHQIRSLLGEVGPEGQRRRALGLVVPHAGYRYSGLTAAHGYHRLRGQHYATVVVVGPSHREYFDGVAVFPGDAYSTPLGEIPVDPMLRDSLTANSPLISKRENGHREEHAIEVQLPFLQEVLQTFMILPVVIGDQRRECCLLLGEALGEVCRGKDVLLIASTDLSHYYPGEVADRLDAVIVDDVEKFEYDKLMSDLESGHTEACGGGPAVAVMLALRRLGASTMEILHHCNSGDITGDRSSVVGYLSAAAYA